MTKLSLILSFTLLVGFCILTADAGIGKLKYVSVIKRNKCRRFDVTIRVDCYRGWFKRPSKSQLNRLCNLIRSGISKYWSRSITYNGQPWTVRVNTIQVNKGSRKKILVKYYKKKPGWFGNDRSHNSDILPMTMKYRTYRANRDESFKKTAGHEFGHSVLSSAHSRSYSWRHKGTSTWYGKRISNTCTPTSGEIDLMKYYKNCGSVWGYYSRSKAAKSDVVDLVLKVRRTFTTSNAPCFG